MLRALGILVALLVLLVGAAALLLPVLVSGDEARSRLERLARDATGRELTYDELKLGLLPPRFVVSGASLSGATPEDPPFAEAREIDLRLSVLPLLAGAVVVDSLELEGATVRLLRTEDGIQWPRPAEEDEPEEGKEPREPREARPARREPQIAVRRLDLEDVRLILDDRAVSPPTRWDVSSVSGGAEADGLEGPIRVALSGDLAPGSVRVDGVAALDRTVDLCLELDGVQLAPLRGYLRPGSELDGAVTGKIHLRGAAVAADRLAAALQLSDARIDVAELSAQGQLALEATLSGPPFTGPFHLDAGNADLQTGGSVGFNKPRGMPAVASGRLESRDGRYDVDGVRVEIGGGGPAASGADPCVQAPR